MDHLAGDMNFLDYCGQLHALSAIFFTKLAAWLLRVNSTSSVGIKADSFAQEKQECSTNGCGRGSTKDCSKGRLPHL